MHTDQPKYQANPEVSCRDEGQGGGLLFNPDTNGVLVLNRSGLAMWGWLRQPQTVAELGRRLVETYQGVTAEQAENDAAAFVRSLLPAFASEISHGN